MNLIEEYNAKSQNETLHNPRTEPKQLGIRNAVRKLLTLFQTKQVMK